MGLANDLKHRLTVYQRTKTENDIGETEFVYRPAGKVWGALTITGGAVETLPGEMERASVTHRLTLRTGACRLATDTYFEYQGQRYDVLYWQPHYKRRDRIEVLLRMVTEDA